MLWQDAVISVANVIFSISLIPQIYYGFKRKKGFVTLPTAGMTFVCLYAISVAFFTLALWTSAIVSAVTGTMWLILFIQGIIYDRA